MPRQKGGQLKGDQLKAARQGKSEKQAIAESDTALDDLWSNFNQSKAYAEELEHKLTDQAKICTDLQNDFKAFQDLIDSLRAEILSLKSKNSDIYHQLRMERQRCKRATSKHGSMSSQILLLKKADAISSAQFSKGLRDSAVTITKLLKVNEDLRTELSQSVTTWSSRTEALTEAAKSKLMSSDTRLKNAQKEITKLRKGFHRATQAKEHAVSTAKAKIIQQKSVHHLSHKGVFTQKTRNLVRFLSQSGCSANRINNIINAVLKTAGITMVGSISRTSVARIIREGYFAAQIQLGHEMKMAETMTFSADGTGHRSINYNSRHAHMLVEDYGSLDSGKTRATRFLGIKPSRDGSSKEAIVDWKTTITGILDLYNRSPFGKRSGGSLIGLVDILVKLTGMNTDHCAKEKKDAREMEELKKWAVNQHLGEDAMLEKSLPEIYELQMSAQRKMIQAAGGQQKWEALPEATKAEKRAKMVENVVQELGKGAFELLNPHEKRLLRLFIWAGCGCHKDLNTVRGGYVAMEKWWKEHHIEGPVLLANRDNDMVLAERNQAIAQGDEVTPAQEQALNRSTCGAIKTAQIAGAIFNHKDDKKGHHDFFRDWWKKHVNIPFTFPDTSNNRFQSYCYAAAALLLYLQFFQEFLEHLRITKQNGKLNHMESNLWKALHDKATLAELAILALYGEAVSYPYVKAIRTTSESGETQNMLDLGPLHQKVSTHIRAIIANPFNLLCENPSYSTASLDGDEWQHPNIFKSIKNLDLPYLKELLVAFFTGADETWTRFTSEFAPGGLIDAATTEERDLAWMPATNDENEGALGSFRKLIRQQPQLTMQAYNGLTMFFRNNTELFMEAKFTTEEDYKFLHKIARETGSGEQEWRKAGVDYRDDKQDRLIEKRRKKEKKAQENAERIAGTAIILDKKIVSNLKGNHLLDQIKIFKEAGAPNLEDGIPKYANDKRQALVDAVELYEKGVWITGRTEDWESEGEDFGFEDIDNATSDTDSD
jgi:hypothetical protein